LYKNTSLSINNSMSKPFKSQFDLMAEAYGNVNYSKQRIINEDTAGKTVIGYPPSKLNEVHSFHSEGDDDYYYDESDYNRVLDLVDKKGRGWKESSVTSGVEEDHVDQFLKDMQKWMDDNNIDGGPGVGDHKEGLFAASLRKAEEAGENEEGKGAAKFTLQGVGGMHGQTVAGDSKSFNSLEEVCAAAGIDVEKCKKAELWDDMGDGTKEFQVDEDNVIVMQAEDAEEQPGDDFFEALDDVLMVTGTENAHAVVSGMEVKLGRKLSPLETEHAHNVIQDDELPEDNEHAEPVAIVSMDTEEVGDCGSEDHADDSEMHMAQAELYKATEYAGKLSELLNGIDSLEGWTASKITRASDYLSSVYHWLDYETNGKGRFNTGYEDAPVHPAEDNQ
jgi:hypothetical protein